MSRDAKLIIAAQGLRGFAYGFSAVLLGVVLAERGYSSTVVGLVLTSVVLGAVGASLLIGRHADQWGRRRCYSTLYAILAISGAAMAIWPSPVIFIIVGLSGAMSTEVVESGPFSSLEQSMLAGQFSSRRLTHGYGVYNAVASGAGSLGSLAAGLPAILRHWWTVPSNSSLFMVLAPVALAGLLLGQRLSNSVEAPQEHRTMARRQLSATSRPVVTRLSALFATDSLGSGFVLQSFVAYWLTRRFSAPLTTIGVVFFFVGLLQAVSFLLAIPLARRFGLLRTMVFSHLPSNVLLALTGLAPNLGAAVALLLCRTTLSQMDVPTRQAYVMIMVDEVDRTAAASYTNTARYVTRPIGPVLAGSLQSLGLGAPFLVAGALKSIYDVTLWRLFSSVPVDDGD